MDRSHERRPCGLLLFNLWSSQKTTRLSRTSQVPLRTARAPGPRVTMQEWVGASVKYRRAVEWAPAAELQLEEACSERRRKGDGAPMRFFRGDHEGAKM